MCCATARRPGVVVLQGRVQPWRHRRVLAPFFGLVTSGCSLKNRQPDWLVPRSQDSATAASRPSWQRECRRCSTHVGHGVSILSSRSLLVFPSLAFSLASSPRWPLFLCPVLVCLPQLGGGEVHPGRLCVCRPTPERHTRPSFSILVEPLAIWRLRIGQSHLLTQAIRPQRDIRLALTHEKCLLANALSTDRETPTCRNPHS